MEIPEFGSANINPEVIVEFKGEDESKPAPTQNALERIRELETQLNDLKQI